MRAEKGQKVQALAVSIRLLGLVQITVVDVQLAPIQHIESCPLGIALLLPAEHSASVLSVQASSGECAA